MPPRSAAHEMVRPSSNPRSVGQHRDARDGRAHPSRTGKQEHRPTRTAGGQQTDQDRSIMLIADELRAQLTGHYSRAKKRPTETKGSTSLGTVAKESVSE